MGVNVGDVYDAPWGRYVVHRVSPRVLRSVERPNAFIVDPGSDYERIGESRVAAEIDEDKPPWE